MEYWKLPLICECGGVPKRISVVGLSTTHELVVHWRCPWCRKNVYLAKPLAECWRECSTEEPAKLANSDRQAETADDLMFLHSIGVNTPGTMFPTFAPRRQTRAIAGFWHVVVPYSIDPDIPGPIPRI